MTRGIATARANALLDSELDDRWIQLHVGDPGAAGTANVSAGSTTRLQAVTAGAAGGVKGATGIGPWTHGGGGGGVEELTDYSVWTASTAGTFIMSVPLDENKEWETDDEVFLDVEFTLGPQAA